MPVLYEGVAWIYDGDTLCPMPEDMRRRIYDEIGTDFSGKICEGATFDDLDETAIENFRSNWIEKAAINSLQHGQGIRFSLIVVPSRIVA